MDAILQMRIYDVDAPARVEELKSALRGVDAQYFETSFEKVAR